MGLNQKIIAEFKTSFENQCFQLICDAYKSCITEKVIQLDWHENDITAELHKHIEVNPYRSEKQISSNVEHHLPKDDTKKEKGFAAKFTRIDLRLTTFKSKLEYKYFFEAKNLKETDSHLKRRYIDTGVNSFCSGKYTNGSLIGYLLSGNVNKTINGINSLLIKDNRSLETLITKNNPINDHYYESQHVKINTLKHIMFDFTCLN